MDQASGLRQLMNKKEKEAAVPSTAFIFASQIESGEEFVELLACNYAEKKEKKISIVGSEIEKIDNIEKKVRKGTLFTIEKKKINQHVDAVPGSMKIIEEAIKNRMLLKRLIKLIEEEEKEADQLFICAGKGVTSIAINIARATTKVIIIAKPTKESLLEVYHMVNFISKNRENKEIGLIMDTSDYIVYEKQMKKIQELCWSEFKYYIEPIGCFEMKYASLFREDEVFEGFNFEYLEDVPYTKSFSEAISKATIRD